MLDSKILSQIKKIVTEQEPKAKIYLYGSRSRGTAKSNSDWDLLILLNKDKISPKTNKELPIHCTTLNLTREK
jgi:uncharacterized protein